MNLIPGQQKRKPTTAFVDASSPSHRHCYTETALTLGKKERKGVHQKFVCYPVSGSALFCVAHYTRFVAIRVSFTLLADVLSAARVKEVWRRVWHRSRVLHHFPYIAGRKKAFKLDMGQKPKRFESPFCTALRTLRGTKFSFAACFWERTRQRPLKTETRCISYCRGFVMQLTKRIFQFCARSWHAEETKTVQNSRKTHDYRTACSA